MDGRATPFDEEQLIGAVPFNLVMLSDKLASAVQKVACRRVET